MLPCWVRVFRYSARIACRHADFLVQLNECAELVKSHPKGLPAAAKVSYLVLLAKMLGTLSEVVYKPDFDNGSHYAIRCS